MKPVEIDFSKIKIPPFLNYLESGGKEPILQNESNEKIF